VFLGKSLKSFLSLYHIKIAPSSVINAYHYSFFCTVNVTFLWNKMPVSVCNINLQCVFCSAVLNHFVCMSS